MTKTKPPAVEGMAQTTQASDAFDIAEESGSAGDVETSNGQQSTTTVTRTTTMTTQVTTTHFPEAASTGTPVRAPPTIALQASPTVQEPQATVGGDSTPQQAGSSGLRGSLMGELMMVRKEHLSLLEMFGVRKGTDDHFLARLEQAERRDANASASSDKQPASKTLSHALHDHAGWQAFAQRRHCRDCGICGICIDPRHIRRPDGDLPAIGMASTLKQPAASRVAQPLHTPPHPQPQQQKHQPQSKQPSTQSKLRQPSPAPLPRPSPAKQHGLLACGVAFSPQSPASSDQRRPQRHSVASKATKESSGGTKKESGRSSGSLSRSGQPGST